jgi:hypothetical protein
MRRGVRVDPEKEKAITDNIVDPYAESEEIPPAPGEDGDLAVASLAIREEAKLMGMSDEQRERYDAAQADIMAHPAVAAFAQEEERAKAAKEETRAAFLAAYRKKQKEKS